MKMKKMIVMFIGICLLALLLCGCDGGRRYRTDLTSWDVMEEILDEMPHDGAEYRLVGDDFISASSFGEGYRELLSSSLDWSVVVSRNADTNVSEIGVFRVREDIDMEGVLATVSSYVDAQKLRLPPLLEMYNPDELPRVENARVERFGQYVVYTILNENELSAVRQGVVDALTDD
jgi:hypothetical protein